MIATQNNQLRNEHLDCMFMEQIFPCVLPAIELGLTVCELDGFYPHSLVAVSERFELTGQVEGGEPNVMRVETVDDGVIAVEFAIQFQLLL